MFRHEQKQKKLCCPSCLWFLITQNFFLSIDPNISLVSCIPFLSILSFPFPPSPSGPLLQDESPVRQRLFRYDDGGVFGQIAFMLRHPRDMHAEAVASGCLYELHRKDLETMERECPRVALAVHAALMKSVCLSMANQHDTNIASTLR